MDCETGKQKFETYSEAERVRAERRHHGAMQVYSCKRCGGFHIGSHQRRLKPKDVKLKQTKDRERNV